MGRPLLPRIAYVLLLSTTSHAFAQANYDAALIGGRSSLTGGTGVATGTDAAAPLQNPATIVGIEGTSFVFSTMFVELSNRHIGSFLDSSENLVRGDDTLDQTQFSVLPNSTCLFLDLVGNIDNPRGQQKLSICFTEPENESFELNSRALLSAASLGSAFENRYLRQIYSKKVYTASWAYGLTERLSIGLAPMLQEMRFESEEAIVTLLSTSTSTDPSNWLGESGVSATTYLTRRAHGFSGTFLAGLRYVVSDSVTVGASFESPGFRITGDYHSNFSSESRSTSREGYSQESGSATFGYPFRAAFGVSGRFSTFSVEGNLYVHGARGDFFAFETDRDSIEYRDARFTAYEPGPASHAERVKAVTNAGIGVTVPMNHEWALLFGALTDFSGLTNRTPSTSIESSNLFRSRYDAVHGSVGVAWTPPMGSILLGLRGFYGSGDVALTSDAGARPAIYVLDQSLWGISAVISGQLTLEMLARVDPTGLVETSAGPAAPPASKK